ncbi:MAG: ribosome assembly factor SBDS [archaeon]|nr:ribosome assembly factor SBDS [Nanoarchaeota archaeon]
MSEEKINLARLRKFGQVFEISVDPDLAMKFKEGELKDISEVLKSEQIFSDAKKGQVVSQEELQKVFKSTDVLEIASRIVREGEVQSSSEYRGQEREQKKRKLIGMIHRMAIDPKTNLPHPPQRIELALEQAKVNLDDHKTIEEQFDRIISKLQPIIPIKIEQKIMTIRIPAAHIGRSNNLIRNNSKILKEGWNSDGSWTVRIEIPAGFQQDLIDQLNSVTRGEVEIDIENERNIS